MYYVISKSDADVLHFGIKRRSGRYPWGSGERPYQDRDGPIVKNKKLGQERRERGKLQEINIIKIIQKRTEHWIRQYMVGAE